ncbi:MAG TPA: amidohydrolase [Vicinamibacteria bacterium]|nr:amidohydrolase [Vicinamibacteria bacterium]
MKRTTTVLLFSGLLSCAGTPPEEPADLVLRNGKIVTVDETRPQAQALAAKDGLIVAVGSDEELEPYIGDETRVIDLGGMLAVPGLIEGHGHYMSWGASLMELELRHARSWEEIVATVAEAVESASPGEWIVGRGWHQDKWDHRPSPSVEGLPTHEGLSAASPENPVFLSHTSGHGVFANAKAMELAGISRESTDPPGGEIVRDSQGNPIGMLREAAAQPLRDALAMYRGERPAEEIEKEQREQVRLAAEAAIANGITSFQDMGSSFATIDLLNKMADEGALPLRLYVAVQETAADMKDRLSSYRTLARGNGFLTVRAIGEKVLDGALGTHGGWLLEPYSDLPRSVGFNVTPVEDIEASAALAAEHNYQMAIQGIGDRAARVLFDIYEREFERHPEKSDYRWRIEHAQVIHPDDLPRFAKLGVIPGIQGIFACSDGPWVVDRLGEERTRERGYLYRSMIDSGAVVMNGTDPPVEEIDPIASFHCSVTRELPDGTIFLPEQAMTREQALRSYTLNNAFAAFEDDVKGSLTPGKYADITVFSKDLLTIPDDEIRSAEVVYTIIGGEVRFERPKS